MPDFPIGYGPGFSGNDGSFGTLVAANAAAHTKGSWGELIASTSFDADAALFVIGSSSLTQQWMGDLAIGGAGSEVAIVSNLLIGGAGQETRTILVPGSIPAGSRISGRCQSTAGSGSARFRVMLLRGGLWGAPPGGMIETLGANTGTTRGAALNAGAAANTYGAWVELSSSTSADIAALQFALGNAASPSAVIAGTTTRLATGLLVLQFAIWS